VNLTTQVMDLPSQSLQQMKAAQARVASLNERIAGSVTATVPPVPNPLAGRLPAPTSVVAGYFDFLAEVQSANRQFCERLLGAWERGGSGPAR
jgi:hypothetical protein